MIIGISGKIGSGKNTLSDIIRTLDNRFIEKTFAFKLKQVVAIISGTTMEEGMSQEGKKNIVKEFNKSIGELHQIIGTDCLRNHFDKDVWVKAMFTDYHNERWIIPDVRFTNEANYIKRLGGIIIRLEGDPKDIRANSNRDINHSSETELDNYEQFDYVYTNDKGIEELNKFALSILKIV